MKRAWTCGALIALAASLSWCESKANASAMNPLPLSYESGGVVYPNSDPVDYFKIQTFDPFVRFREVALQPVDLSAPIKLGAFEIAALSPGQSKTYSDARFELQVNFMRDRVETGLESLIIVGRLNGVVDGSKMSTLHASFDNISLLPYNDTFPIRPATGDFFPPGDLRVLGPVDLTVIPGVKNSFAIMGEVRAVPEPATAAILAGGVLAIAVRKRRKSGGWSGI